MLAEFARRIRAEIREVDLAFRQGGEEFVVLLPETDAAGRRDRRRAARRGGAASSRSSSSRAGGEPIRVDVTVSIGVAVYPGPRRPPAQAVLEAADDALYAAKAAGRDDDHLPGATGPASYGAAEIAVPSARELARRRPAACRRRRVTGAQPPRQSRGG